MKKRGDRDRDKSAPSSEAAAAALRAAARRGRVSIAPSASASAKVRRSSCVGAVCMVAACVAVCLCLCVYQWGQDSLMRTLDVWLSEGEALPVNNATASSNASVNANTSASASIPDYATYVGRTHMDPVDKLTDTIRKIPQVFDLDSPAVIEEKSDEYLDLLHEEIQFLLKVLIKSSRKRETQTVGVKESQSKDIDLTDALHVALDTMNQCYYRIIKHRILLKNPRIVTKSDVESWTRHWMGEPLKDIMSIKAANRSSIVIDTNRLTGTGKFDALMKATQYRLYGLLSMFVSQGSTTISRSLHIAIINGDDLAVALLLKLHGDIYSKIHNFASLEAKNSLSSVFMTVDALMTHIDDAATLKYHTIQSRLTAALLHMVQITLASKIGNISEISSKSLVVAHQFLHDHINGHVVGDEFEYSTVLYEANERKDDIEARLRQDIIHSHVGEINSVLKHVPLSNEFLSSSADSPGSCDVDVIDLTNLTVADFFQNYIRLNKPVILRFPLNKDLLESHWSRDAILKVVGDMQVVLSSIPYGSLFGEAETHWSLKNYFEYIDAFHSKVSNKSYVDFYDSAVKTGGIVADETNPTSSAAVHVKPLYLFGNNQQGITNALKKNMVHYLSQSTDGNHSLWDFIMAVSSNQSIAKSMNMMDVPAHRAKYQLFYGAHFSGAPMHSHGPAFNILLKGEKLWNLLPPGRDLYTNIHPLEWFATGLDITSDEYPYRNPSQSLPLCQLRQLPGDILYVPRHFSHQVLNLGKETVGFAVEVDAYIY